MKYNLKDKNSKLNDKFWLCTLKKKNEDSGRLICMYINLKLISTIKICWYNVCSEYTLEYTNWKKTKHFIVEIQKMFKFYILIIIYPFWHKITTFKYKKAV